MRNKVKAAGSKRRRINKALDRNFALRNQRASAQASSRRGKSQMDLADVPRRNRNPRGVRRTQLGESLNVGELATRDPYRPEGQS